MEPQAVSSAKKDSNEQASGTLMRPPRYLGNSDANAGQGAGGSLATAFVEVSLPQARSSVPLPRRGPAGRCSESQSGRGAGRPFLLAGDVPAVHCG